MERLITHAPEPKKLYLAWQAPDQMAVRFRWAVGVVEPDEGGLALRYFQDDDEFRKLNAGQSLSAATALSYQGYPGLPTKRTLWPGIQGALMRRLPPRSRHDFGDYIRQFRISPELPISDFTLLGLTEAKLPSDGFSLVDPLSAEHSDRDLMLEVAGFRYYCEGIDRLDVGDPVAIQLETDNAHDSNAVMFTRHGSKIGNVNRLQAATFREWLSETSVTGVVERLNGSAARPRAFVFVQVRKHPQLLKQELVDAV